MKHVIIVIFAILIASIQSHEAVKTFIKLSEEHVVKQIAKAVWEEGKWEIPEKAFEFSEKRIIRTAGKRYFMKAIPIISGLTGLYFAGQRIRGKEPWYMVGCEVASGV